MSYKPLLAAVALLPLSFTTLSGCQSATPPNQKAQAKEEWNSARSNVLGSLARDQYTAGNLDKSRETLNQALVLSPKKPELHVLSAKLSLETGDLESADKSLKEARTLDTKNELAELDYLSGILAQRWQKNQDAANLYADAAKKDPKQIAYPLAQAEMLVILDRPADALTLLQSKVASFEHSPALRDAIGQLQLQQGKLTEAVETLRHATILATDDASIREHYAIALHRAGKYPEAADNLARLLRDPNYAKRADILSLIADAHLRQNKFREARAALETANRLPNCPASVLLNLARVHIELGDLARADSALKRALATNPNAEAHLLLGYLRLKQNNLPEALNAFKKSAALDPKDPTPLTMIGVTLEKQKKPNDALAYYSRALQLNPNAPLASQAVANISLTE